MKKHLSYSARSPALDAARLRAAAARRHDGARPGGPRRDGRRRRGLGDVLAKGPQDPHFVEARPSFVRVLHDADLLIVVGLELETGWLPVLLQGARNRA